MPKEAIKPNKKLINTVVKDGGLPVAIAVISLFSPILGIAGIAGKAIWDILKKHQQDRIIESNKNVGTDVLINLFESERSRDVLHRVLRNIMDESSLEKRKLFYNYLKNLDKRSDLQKENDRLYHSKIISVINQITFEELDMLNTCFKYGDSFKKRNKNNITLVNDRIIEIEEHGLLQANLTQIVLAFEDINNRTVPVIGIVRGVQALNSYGLIDINYPGNSNPAIREKTDKFANIDIIINSTTPFGKRFWGYISDNEYLQD